MQKLLAQKKVNGTQTNITYCYNRGIIYASDESGGIVGGLYPFEKDSYTNNYLYYCYNIGNTSSNGASGGMASKVKCIDGDYIYGLKGTSKNNSLWDIVEEYRNATHQDVLEKADLISTIKKYFGTNFKDDKDNINEGYPILSWQ